MRQSAASDGLSDAEGGAVENPPAAKSATLSAHTVPRVFLVAVVLLAALTAAAAAHTLIDVIGDFALAHDSYDGMAHHARTLAFVAVLVVALAGALRLLWSALNGAHESTAPFQALVKPILALPAWRFAAGVAVLALVAVMAMEAGDALFDGVRIDDFAELFGGSIALGFAVTLAMSALLGLAVARLFRAVAAAHACMVDVVCALLVGVRRSCGSPSALRTALSLESFGAPTSVISTRAAKRAPPPLLV